MRFAYFVALAVSAGIAIAQDESPTKAKEAFDKAAVCLWFYTWNRDFC